MQRIYHKLWVFFFLDAGKSLLPGKDLEWTWFYAGGDERNLVKDKGSIPPGIPVILGGSTLEIQPVELPPTAYYPGLRPSIQQTVLAEREAAVRQQIAAVETARKSLLENYPKLQQQWDKDPEDYLARRTAENIEWKVLAAEATLAAEQAELASAQARIAADRARYSGISEPNALAQTAHQAECIAAVRKAEAAVAVGQSQLAEAESQPAGSDEAKRKKNLAAPMKQIADANAALAKARATQTDSSKNAEYAPLSSVYPTRSTGRRRALAQWIASNQNPLTARVAINHIWMRHFQSPLVASTSRLCSA